MLHCAIFVSLRYLGLYHSHVFSICVHQWTLYSLYPVVLKISKHFMNNNFLRCKLLET